MYLFDYQHFLVFDMHMREREREREICDII